MFTSRRAPLVIAHAGCEGSPANTVASVMAGIASGADAIEIDLRTTADGTPVLVHDPFILDADGGRLAVAELDYAGLLRAGGPEKQGFELPLPLDDVLHIAVETGCVLNVDIKDDRSVPLLLGRIREFRLEEGVVITGCELKRAAAVTAAHPRARVLLNAWAPPAGGRSDADDAEYAAELCRAAIEIGCCGINIDHTYCTARLVQTAHRRFLPVAVWTVDEDEHLRRMVEMGVFSITTHRPRYLIGLAAGATSARAL